MKLVEIPKGRGAQYSEMEYFVGDSKGAQEKGRKAAPKKREIGK